MSKLKIEVDNTEDAKLVLGGLALLKVPGKEGEKVEIEFVKILGLYEKVAETFNLVQKEIIISDQESLIPAKLTIDGINVAKESYRIFISNLDSDFNYTVKTYLKKPKPNTKAEVIDLALLNGHIFNRLANKEVTIGEYNFKHHNYNAITSGGIEIHLRRSQFVLEDNKMDVAILRDINS